MAITISGENNNDKILASDGVIDSLSGFNIVGVITATSFTGDLTGDVTGNLIGNVTGNINNSTLLLQTGGTERIRITSGGQVGIATNNPNGQFHIHQSSAGSVTAATDANDLVIESSTNVGMSLLTANNSLARIKFGDPDETGAGVIVYNHQNDKFSIITAAGNRMIIGSDMISARTHYGIARTAGGYTFRETNEGGERAGLHSDASNNLIFKTDAASEKLRIDSIGRFLLGTTSARTSVGAIGDPYFQLEGLSSDSGGMSIIRNSDSAAGPYLVFGKTRGTSDGSNTIVQANDTIGSILFAPADGNDVNQVCASISAMINGTPGSNDVPGALTFRTTADGGTSPTERLRIDSSGRVLIGGTSNSASSHADELQIINTSAEGGISIINGDSSMGHIYFGDTSGSAQGRIDYNHGGNYMRFYTANTERLRIDSSGRLIIGHTGTYAVAGHYPALQLSGTTYNGATIGIINNANDATGAYIQLSKQRSGSPAGATIVQNNDIVGNITFTAADGTDLTSRIAEIKALVDGTPGSNDTPGRLSFWTTPDGAQSSLERIRIDSSGRTSVGRNLSSYVASNMSVAANDFIVTTGAGSNGGMSIVNSGADIGNIFFAQGSSENSIGRIQYDHSGDDFIFTAGGNARGRIYNDAGVTGIEHHQFHPFLIGYDAQTASNVTMKPRFGGMSCLPIDYDGDKAYMSYTTHWRHRQYAGVYFWYGASGNTSGHTFDWDFTVWSATHNEGYSVGSQHTFTIATGSMSNGKMYRMNALSSWPSHHSSELVQFVIEYDEIQNGTSLQLTGMEIVEYTTP